MKTLTKPFVPAVLVAGAIMVLAIVLLFKPVFQAQGSVQLGSDYAATTTTAATFQSEQLVQSGPGSLGSVVITGAATGVINIYDATTTSILNRAASLGTSTILVASFPASTAAGTYTFDRRLYYGLWIELIGTVPTTTITYR